MSKSRASVQDKIEFLRLAENIGNVAEACRIANFSRDSYYRYKRLYDSGGEEALLRARSRRRPAHDGGLDAAERAVLDIAKESPTLGRLMVSKLLHRRGITLSPSAIRLVWKRFNLQQVENRRRWAASASPEKPAMKPQEQHLPAAAT